MEIPQPVFKRMTISAQPPSPQDLRESPHHILSLPWGWLLTPSQPLSPLRKPSRENLVSGPGWGAHPINKGTPLPYLGSSSQVRGP